MDGVEHVWNIQKIINESLVIGEVIAPTEQEQHAIKK